MKSAQIFTEINRLQVPMVVQDILSGHEDVSVASFGLSGVISDMQPDQALVAVSLGVVSVIEPYLTASPLLRALRLHSDRMVDAHLENLSIVDSDKAQAYWDVVLEDLLSSTDLIDHAVCYLEHKDIVGHKLLVIMREQLKAHTLVVETVRRLLTEQDEQQHYKDLERKSVRSDNVITASF